MMRPPILPALLVAFSLVGQEAPKAEEAKPAITKLTLQSAIETSLKNNLQVQIAIETRDFTRAGMTIEEGAFDWNLTSSLNSARPRTPAASRISLVGPSLPPRQPASAATSPWAPTRPLAGAAT